MSKMMLTSPLPSWRQIFFPKMTQEKEYWKNALWTTKSGVSIRLIIQAYSNVLKKKIIKIWIPDFFCAETEEEFKGKNVLVIKYPITEQMEPNWNIIKDEFSNIEIDIFLFVHYFGKYCDINPAWVYCNNRNAILVEDCAHVLYKYGKIGQKGDFVIFSPHKILPIPDGGIILHNHSNIKPVSDIWIQLNALISSGKRYALSKVLKWKVKKIIQKLIKINKPTNYEYKEHYLTKDYKAEKSIRISKYSYKVLQGYSYEDYKRIAFIRNTNMQLMSHIIKKTTPLIPIASLNKNECPFLCVFSFKDILYNNNIIKNIQKAGINILYWPSLSADILNQSYSGVARQLSKELLYISIHQDIKPDKIARAMPYKLNRRNKKQISIDKIENTNKDKIRWEDVLKKADLSNITQDWQYGEAKRKAEKWKIDRYIIRSNNRDIGIVQVLCKRILGATIACRINKGPILINEEKCIENELYAVEFIRKRYHFIPFFYVPYLPMHPDDFWKITNMGWKNWDIFGFPSGVIDLTRSVDEIRASLNSKWRNQLKNAERFQYRIQTDSCRFEEMCDLYEKEQHEKKFTGVSKCLLKEIAVLRPSPLCFFYIENSEHKIIAFDIFYKHVNTATYYIGWNSEEGRKNYTNNLLLFYAALSLKESGVKQLDLGGIEYIYTEGIAKFKDGMNPKHYRQMGEFFKVG